MLCNFVWRAINVLFPGIFFFFHFGATQNPCAREGFIILKGNVDGNGERRINKDVI